MTVIDKSSVGICLVKKNFKELILVKTRFFFLLLMLPFSLSF